MVKNNTISKKKILLAEDEVYISDIYITSLKNAGFKVDHVKDGKECILKLKNKKFDLLLLDLLLPKIDGFEILRKIKNDPKLKNIPVIVLTNLTGKDTPDKVISLRAKECLIKSNFTPKEIVEKVKTYL